VVKAAKDGHRYDAPERRHGSAERCILTEGQVRADTVVVASVGLKHAAKMRFAKYYEVVEAFPTDRVDEPLSLPFKPSGGTASEGHLEWAPIRWARRIEWVAPEERPSVARDVCGPRRSRRHKPSRSGEDVLHQAQ